MIFEQRGEIPVIRHSEDPKAPAGLVREIVRQIDHPEHGERRQQRGT